MNFADKYKLTPEQSRFLAKKKLDENIYCGMRMENGAVTFLQTQTILNGLDVPNIQLDGIQAILNIRDAWKYLLSHIDEPIALEYLCKLNELIARNIVSNTDTTATEKALEAFVLGGAHEVNSSGMGISARA